MKVYIAVKLFKNEPPVIVGVFKKKSDAEKAAYTKENWGDCFSQVIEKEVK